MQKGKYQLSLLTVDNGYDPVFGARPLKRFLQKNVETLAAKLILSEEISAGDVILIDLENGELKAKVDKMS